MQSKPNIFLEKDNLAIRQRQPIHTGTLASNFPVLNTACGGSGGVGTEPGKFQTNTAQSSQGMGDETKCQEFSIIFSTSN